MFRRLMASCAVLALLGCTPGSTSTSRPADSGLDQQRFARDLEVLSSDGFQGRAPASPGETRTVAYIAEGFQAAGLAPANGDSYFQPVPLVAVTAAAVQPLTFSDGGPVLTYREHMSVWTKRLVERASLADSQLVFVGYGIVAPEFGWNDYAGVDVRGKTVVMLVNDPGFASKDPALFNGNAMTYYGRWTYKYEEAARQGAAGALIVHETDAAGYPWDVVSGSWAGPQFDLGSADRNMHRAVIEGWLRRDAAVGVFKRAGLDLDDLAKAAARPGFRARLMALSVSASVMNDIRRSDSRNVVGRIKGVRYPAETILYMAHWDHLGIDPALEGDQIFNGAVDNATGLAGLLELARVFGRGPRPQRSLVFLALTAEESGLLGSQYYAEQPLSPLATTVAAFNMDGLNVYGPTRDVVVVGHGSSELEDYLAAAVAEQGRIIVPEPTPEKGFFYRSDHLNFARHGVPVLYAKSGADHLSGGVTYGRRKAWEYSALRYHKVADEFDPGWDLSGAVLDLALLYRVGSTLANSRAFPNWYPGNEFRARRDSSEALRRR
jgi:Zn-dependent M28 family amino/carboxypeptidase